MFAFFIAPGTGAFPFSFSVKFSIAGSQKFWNVPRQSSFVWNIALCSPLRVNGSFGGNMFFRNIGRVSTDYVALYPGRYNHNYENVKSYMILRILNFLLNCHWWKFSVKLTEPLLSPRASQIQYGPSSEQRMCAWWTHWFFERLISQVILFIRIHILLLLPLQHGTPVNRLLHQTIVWPMLIPNSPLKL